MTAEYVWSPSSAGFYPLIEKERLKAAGGWPEDGVDVSSEEYAALFPAPSGKYIGNVDGRPGFLLLLQSSERRQHVQNRFPSGQRPIRKLPGDRMPWTLARRPKRKRLTLIFGKNTAYC